MALFCGLALAACSSSSSGRRLGLYDDRPGRLLHPGQGVQKLIAAFEATPAGKGINIQTSFGPSGTQATDVVNGSRPTSSNFSLEPDMAKLVKANLVSSDWDTVGPDDGIVTDSVVVFVVKKGNPKNIQNWSDLVKSGSAGRHSEPVQLR